MTNATVTLHGLTHTCPEDLNVLLVAPNGSNVVLTAQTGSCDEPTGDVTFDDAAALYFGESGTDAAGTWKPDHASISSEGDCNWTGSLVSPAPGGPYGSTMASVTGGPASGTWKLYIEDGCGGDDALTSRHSQPRYGAAPRFSSPRAMISRWISLVPSQIRSTRSSR